MIATAPAPSLDNNAPNASHADRRLTAYELRSVSQQQLDIRKHKRQIGCGQWARGGEVAVTLSPEQRAGFRGLQHCASPWACVVCALKIQRGRAEEIRTVLRNAIADGYVPVMTTFTVSHSLNNPLVETLNDQTGELVPGVWDAISIGWRGMTGGKGWQELKAQFGLSHYIRITEVTRSENTGWHVHLHVIWLFPRVDDLAIPYLAGNAMFLRWQAAVERAGFKAQQSGFDVTVADDEDTEEAIARYLSISKLDWIALETYSASKKGRGASRTPFQILADGDYDIWRYWVDSSKGKKSVSWSRGLRSAYGEELTDEELVDVDLGDPEIFVLTAQEFREVVRPRGSAHFLTFVEDRAARLGSENSDGTASSAPGREESGSNWSVLSVLSDFCAMIDSSPRRYASQHTNKGHTSWQY